MVLSKKIFEGGGPKASLDASYLLFVIFDTNQSDLFYVQMRTSFCYGNWLNLSGQNEPVAGRSCVTY